MIFFTIYLALILTYAEEKAEVNNCENEVKEKVLRYISKIKNNSLEVLALELIEKEKKLDKKIEYMEGIEKQIKLQEEGVDKKINILKNKIAELDKRNLEIKNASGKNIEKLVEITSQMKADKAALVLSEQEESIAARIISRLDSKKSSKIFNSLTKEKSASLQKIILHMP